MFDNIQKLTSALTGTVVKAAITVEDTIDLAHNEVKVLKTEQDIRLDAIQHDQHKRRAIQFSNLEYDEETREAITKYEQHLKDQSQVA